MTSPDPHGSGRATTRTCPECHEPHAAEIQTIAGRDLIVGACPRCFGKPASASRPPPPDFSLTPEEPPEIALETITKPCQGCGEPYTTHLIEVAGKRLDFGKFCRACSEGHERKAVSDRQAAFVANRKAAWEECCPEFYRTEAIEAALPIEKKLAVRTAIREAGGCLIHGDSGTWKTTAMFQGAVKQLIWAKKDVLFISAMEWKPKCSRAAKDCTTEAFLRPFIKAPWLFLDDVGNMGGTGGSTEALHNLLEQRMRAHLPILATTQYTGEALIARFGNHEAGTAITRRLAFIAKRTLKFT